MKADTLNLSQTTMRRPLRTLSAAVLPLLFGACTWFTDFKEQPSIEPWESPTQRAGDSLTPPRGNPQYSVPIQGTVSAGFAVSHTALPDSLAGIANPTAADARSLAAGRMQYQINCAVCHGLSGDGNGTIKRVNAGYGWSPSLKTPSATGRSDGYIYGIIRNGRGAMPSYARVEEAERWDIVNYVRALQGGSADTTLAGYPGQNGTTVPGPSFTAPTRPVPYAKWTPTPTAGSPGVNSATFRGQNENDSYRKLHGAPTHEGGARDTTAGKEKHE